MAGEVGSATEKKALPEGSTEPLVVDPFLGQEITKPAVSEPLTKAEIEEADSEHQAAETEEAEDEDGYDDYYEDDTDYDGYDDEAEGDYEYGSEYEDEDDWDWESEFEKHRPKVREVVLHFPEAAKLEPHELDAAVERILEQSKPEHTSVAAPGKIRLLSDDISGILSDKMEPPITWYPADLIPEIEKSQDEFEEFRAKIRKDLIQKGYAEVDEDYYDKRDKFMQQLQEEWNKIDFSRFRIANNDNGIVYYSEEHGGYI